MEFTNIENYQFNKIEKEIPLQPLKNTVVLPYTATPLVIGKKKSITAVQTAMEKDRIVGTFLIRLDGLNKEEIDFTDIHHIGTATGILKLLKMPDSTLRLLVQGLKKIRLEKIVQTEPCLIGQIEIVPETYLQSNRIEAMLRNLNDKFQRLVSISSYLPDELGTAVLNLDDPFSITYMIASIINIKAEERQKILELVELEEKLQLLLSLLNREVQILELGGKIQSEVADEISKSQREFYLREQMKAIKRELGETNVQEVEVKELRERLEGLDLPDEVRKVAEKEMDRMASISNAAPEYAVIRTYLDWLMDLPWRISTQDNLDLTQAEGVLEHDHYDLKEIKERIIEYLAVRKLKQDMKGPILCFVGPPGVGKTSLGQSIARALNRKFIRMSLGGMRDEAEIRGHRRTYIGAMPGKILQSIRRAGKNNPVLMLDEIDKVGADFRGDPSSALLEVLDPEQNVSFMDHYVDLPFDLSKVLFITTANVLQTIHPALRDRMEILRLPGYINEEKIHIAKKYLIPKQIREHGLDPEQIAFDESAIQSIIANYTQEAGVRNLERQIARICRKVAYQVANQKLDGAEVIDNEKVRKYLGPQRIFPETAKRTSTPGVATGLAWTESGGDILFIEALRMPGKKGLTITGQLGEVMQESVKASLSYIRSIAQRYGIKEDYFEQSDLHIHVPAGAIPKDGPSAGTAIATAIASIMIGRAVRKDVAMTGEVTLSGLVLPVGGIREKVLAAKRAGIKTIVLPSRNKVDLEEIPPELIEGIDFRFVDRVDEVLDLALSDSTP
ncbi:MAG: endopeptidase La [bacterium]